MGDHDELTHYLLMVDSTMNGHFVLQTFLMKIECVLIITNLTLNDTQIEEDLGNDLIANLFSRLVTLLYQP